MKHYKEIPGVGQYTSQAVQIFAINVDLVTVDTNIRRIFIKEFHLPDSVSDSKLWDLAQQCLPKGKSRDWHNALMDYGALHLTSKKTGIKPKTQQTRFKGSDRQIRAQIVRTILQGPCLFSQLQNTVRIEKKRLQRILEKMTTEQIITYHKHRYQLKE
jgi:A/G-specific adenine glycosylase